MKLRILKVDDISPNPLQPRESFDREKLKELADTVSDMGVLQPIVVRPKGKRYEIIAGERRWKASQIAGKKEIPAIVKDLPDEEVMVESLIENVHRADLKPVEQAKAILEVFKEQEILFLKKKILSERIVNDRLPQKIAKIRDKIEGKYKDSTFSEEEKVIDKIVKRIGLKHHAIYESLILLRLPESIREEATEKGVGKMELARISAIEDEETQREVFKKVADEGMSYEKTAKLVSVVKDEKVPDPIKKAILEDEIEIERVEPLIEVGITEEKAEELVQELKREKAEEEEWRAIEIERDVAVLKGDLKAKGIIVKRSVDEKRIGKIRYLYDQIRFLTQADFLQIKHKRVRQQAIEYLAKTEEYCHNLRIALEKRM